MTEPRPIAIINNDYDEFLHISYALTSTCNYDCNYCVESSKDGKFRFPDYDLLIKNMDHLLGTYRTHHNKKLIRMNILGGEPTLWPRLGEFVQWCHDKYQCRVTMSSNGSRTLRWWREYAKYFDDIQISVHQEFADVEHIKQVIDIIYAEGTVMTAAQVMMDPNAWDKCLGILDSLISHPTPWLVKTKVVMDLPNKHIRPEYTKEQLDTFEDKVKRMPPREYVDRMREMGKIQNSEKANAVTIFSDGTTRQYNTFELHRNNWHGFYGWECNVGVDRFIIAPNGDIMGSCTARYLFGLDNPVSILDPDFISKFNHTMIKPIICREVLCSNCSSDLRITKKKIIGQKNDTN